MTRTDVAYAYVAYLKARIASATLQEERDKLTSLLNQAYTEMVDELLSEGVFNG